MDQNKLPADFDEEFYLLANPDVQHDVRHGIWKSGGDHYLAYGYSEGRSFCSSDIHFIKDYEKLVASLIAKFPDNYELALAQAIGAGTIEEFVRSGDLQVQVLKLFGLRDNMSIYDLACGCGRTAQALKRSGWQGSYYGADIIKVFTDHVKTRCPGFEAEVNRTFSIKRPSNSVDIIYSWSLFTHLHHEEIYLYMQDSYRSLKQGGKLIFSFLEHNSEDHQKIFLQRVSDIRLYKKLAHLDTFLHRDFISNFSSKIGFKKQPIFIDGNQPIGDYGTFFQSIACLTKS